MIKRALIEAKKLLEYYIENTDELSIEEIKSMEHFIKALYAGCQCDYFNGFDCGCGIRNSIANRALIEIRKLKKFKTYHPNKCER